MDAEIFGKFIAVCRKKIGLTQADLAVKLNVTDKAVSRWERGIGFPDISTIEPLASALEISVPEIMKSKYEKEGMRKDIGFCIQGNYFWPHQVYLTDKGMKDFPARIREHVKNGGKLYVLTEPQEDEVLVSIARDNLTDAVSVHTSDVITKLIKGVKPNVIAVMPEELQKHVKNGGDLYMIGYPKDDKCVIAAGKTPESCSAKVSYYGWAEYEFAGCEKPDYTKAAEVMAECIYKIRKDQDQIGLRAATKLRNYLIWCASQTELEDLTVVYRGSKRDDFIIGYDPVQVSLFVQKLLKKYPKPENIVGRHLKHRKRIYSEIGAMMSDCLDVVQNSKNKEEINKAARLLHMYLEDCLKRGGMDRLTVIYKNRTDNNEIGYELESVAEFVDMLMDEYPVLT